MAITSLYENVPIKQQNPRRKLRRHDVYENYTFKGKENDLSSSVPEKTFVSNAYIVVTTDKNLAAEFPLSPTHYNQPPTPEHPPPSATQAESIIYEKIRPLSQVS